MRRKDVYLEGRNLKTNEYVMLISNANEKKTALGIFINEHTPLRQLAKIKRVYGASSRETKSNLS
jgi:hypothetical protein